MMMPHSTIQRVLPSASARVKAHTAAMSRNTSSASGLLKRNIKVATGVSASTAPAMRAAPDPKCFRTVTYSSATEATPSSTWGTWMDQVLTPKIRAEISMGHNAAGGLSTVIALPPSAEPNRKAFQLWVPACTAAE
ncbi:Uncharacterised protein [Mycobacteroides abscessus subsp. massiliense]|nr:Uncharacterised protein [Mycobacteroides abscessus subsp. massiliense]SLG97079.1 Uncharacterised protein [Mycobacteroides abscessus subsp. massiliense]